MRATRRLTWPIFTTAIGWRRLSRFSHFAILIGRPRNMLPRLAPHRHPAPRPQHHHHLLHLTPTNVSEAWPLKSPRTRRCTASAAISTRLSTANTTCRFCLTITRTGCSVGFPFTSRSAIPCSSRPATIWRSAFGAESIPWKSGTNGRCLSQNRPSSTTPWEKFLLSDCDALDFAFVVFSHFLFSVFRFVPSLDHYLGNVLVDDALTSVFRSRYLVYKEILYLFSL